MVPLERDGAVRAHQGGGARRGLLLQVRHQLHLLLTLGTCRRELTPQHCNTRVRVRVTPHNSRWVTGQGWGGGEHLGEVGYLG